MKEKQEGNDRGQEETIEGEEASMYKEQLDQLDSLDDVLTFGCVDWLDIIFAVAGFIWRKRLPS